MAFPLRSALIAALLVLPAQAFAWGATGHRIIGEVAVENLPAELPAFLRTKAAALAVGEYSRELDRSRGAGRLHGSNRDPAHFFDFDDEGKALGGPPLSALPPTREEYETALRAIGVNTWKAGYLPYAIVDAQQQLAKDFAQYRALIILKDRLKDRRRQAWLKADIARRETLILANVGALSHYVGDGSQPLHVTVHFNGWGPYPNPNGFTTSNKLHEYFEGGFIYANITKAGIGAGMAPFTPCGCDMFKHAADYLAVAGGQVVPLYTLEKAGAFTTGDARGVAFVAERMSAGAAETRNMIAEAWLASTAISVGWRPVTLEQVAADPAEAFDRMYGKDD